MRDTLDGIDPATKEDERRELEAEIYAAAIHPKISIARTEKPGRTRLCSYYDATENSSMSMVMEKAYIEFVGGRDVPAEDDIYEDVKILDSGWVRASRISDGTRDTVHYPPNSIKLIRQR